MILKKQGLFFEILLMQIKLLKNYWILKIQKRFFSENLKLYIKIEKTYLDKNIISDLNGHIFLRNNDILRQIGINFF